MYQDIYYLAQVTTRVGLFRWVTRYAIMRGNKVVRTFNTFEESLEAFNTEYRSLNP